MQIFGFTLGQIFGGGIGILAIVSIFFEVAPFKINPVSSFLKWLGRKLNQEVSAELKRQSQEIALFKSEVAERFASHEKSNDQHEINRMRYEILEFSNECQNGRRHTHRQFEHIIQLYEEYEALIQKWGLTNGKIDQEAKYIMQLDIRCKHDHTYLPDCEEDA